MRAAFDYARLYLEADAQQRAFRETDDPGRLAQAVDAYLGILDLHKDRGAHAVSSSCINRYIRPPLERLQVQQFMLTGKARGLGVTWEAEQLLVNPPFEENAAGQAPGWRGMGAGERGSGTIVRDQAHSGAWALRLQARKRPASEDDSGFAQHDWIAIDASGPRVPVKHGEVYRLSAWINVPEAFSDTKRGVVLNVVGLDAEGTSPRHWTAGTIEVRRMKATDGWWRLAIFRRIDEPKVTHVYARIGLAGTGKVDVDDVELVRGREGESVGGVRFSVFGGRC